MTHIAALLLSGLVITVNITSSVEVVASNTSLVAVTVSAAFLTQCSHPAHRKGCRTVSPSYTAKHDAGCRH